MSINFEATYVGRPLIWIAKAVQEGQTIWFSPTPSGMALASSVQVRTSADSVPLNLKNGVHEMEFAPTCPQLLAGRRIQAPRTSSTPSEIPLPGFSPLLRRLPPSSPTTSTRSVRPLSRVLRTPLTFSVPVRDLLDGFSRGL